MYKCLLCPKEFLTPSRLSTHINSHTKEKPYKCLTCSAAFESIGSLKRHTRHMHDGVKRIKRNKTKKIKCTLCSYECAFRCEMKVHSRKHSGDVYSCPNPGCGFKTIYSASIKRHLVRLHNDERPYECQIDGCNYKAKEADRLREHLKAHSNERPFPCTFPGCNYTFKIKSHLKNHTFSAHCEENPFKCSTCDFETKYKIRLQQHQDGHNNIKRFQCPFPNCDYVCNHRNTIRWHIDSNHRRKNVLCTVLGCKFRCGSNARLKAHTNTTHVKPILKCPEESCNFSSRHLRVLHTHVSRLHGDVQVVLPTRSRQMTSKKAVVPKNLVCSFPDCDYQTEYPHQYDRHIKSHNDEDNRKHECKFCHLKFREYNRLVTHIQRHTEERPYRCSHCDYTTVCTVKLRYHAGNRHNIHVIPCRVNTVEGTICRSCKKVCLGHVSFVLHSMKHLQPVVVLERLQVNMN